MNDKNFNPYTISYHLHKGIYLDRDSSKALLNLLDTCIMHIVDNDNMDSRDRVDTYNRLKDYRSKIMEFSKGLY